MLDDFLIHVFHKGNTLEAYKVFGAHLETNDQKKVSASPSMHLMHEVYKS